ALDRPLVFDFALIDRQARGDIRDTPLSDLTYVVFDTETTGLDPRRDAVVQLGAVRVVNERLIESETFDTLVDPGYPIPPSSTRIHGIDDSMVKDAPNMQSVCRRFERFCRDAVLVAHNAVFDLTLLQ
ncbi:3'-5' exonuclease, partial [Exiguobacterium sp. SH4S7]|uniref:3'-5' exonuclease n=1 Tax=Exiguobacterium sp. SH4S7 TaxID=2510958 RepID=UPI00103EDB67